MLQNKNSLLAVFPHVFNNEFNIRDIKNVVHEPSFGSAVSMAYCMSNRGMIDYQIYGKEYYNTLCAQYRAIDATLVLTKDKDGVTELYRFWTFKGENCYSQLNDETLKQFVSVSV